METASGGPKSKWVLLAAFWLGQAVVVYPLWSIWVCSIELAGPSPSFDFGQAARFLVEPEYIAAHAVILGMLMAGQAVLVFPVRRPAPPLGAGRSSLWGSILLIGLCAGLLTAGLAMAALDAVWLATGLDWTEADGPAPVVGGLGAAVLVGWGAATPLLVAFTRHGDREAVLSRLASRLFLGTLIEAAAIVPLDVMVRRKTDCHCGRGTFWALAICGSVGVLSLGPAVLLPVLARRRKRHYAGRCDACGYDLRGAAGTGAASGRCPECGAGWRGERAGERAAERTAPAGEGGGCA